MKKWTIVCCLLVMVSCGAKVKRIEKAQLHFRAAQELFLKDENIQALAEAQKAHDLNKKDPQVHNFLGILYAQIDEFERAEMHMKRAITLEPRYSEAHVNLCGFMMRREDYDSAMVHCRKAAEDATYPNAERAYHNLGLMHEKKNNQTEAVAMYGKALIHNKNFVLTLQSLGKLHYQQKDYTKAEGLLLRADEACMASPKGAWGTACPDAQYHLALTSIQLSKKNQAISALEHCMETDPQGELKQKCQTNLQRYQ